MSFCMAGKKGRPQLQLKRIDSTHLANRLFENFTDDVVCRVFIKACVLRQILYVVLVKGYLLLQASPDT